METDLERRIGDAARRLPRPAAPATLRPRVMAAVEARRRSAARPWFAWPRAGQAAFVAALLVAASGAVVFAPEAAAASARLPIAWAGAGLAGARGALTDLQAAAVAAGLVLDAVVSQPLVLGFAGLVVVMSVACAACAALIGRVANFGVQGAD